MRSLILGLALMMSLDLAAAKRGGTLSSVEDCSLILSLRGGVQVLLNSSPASLSILDEPQAKTGVIPPWNELSLLRKAGLITSVLGASRNQKNVTTLKQRLRAQPESMDLHRELARALQRTLWWSGIKTKVEPAPEDHPKGYRIRILKKRAFSPGALDWYVDLSRILKTSGVSLEIDTSAFLENRSSFLKNVNNRERWMTLGEPLLSQGFISTLLIQELFHWVHDEMRRAGLKEEAWPAHYLLRKSSLSGKISALPFATLRGPIRGSVNSRFAQFYQGATGFMAEEIGAHALELVLEYKILSRFLSSRTGELLPFEAMGYAFRDPELLHLLETAAKHVELTNLFAEQAYPCYSEAMEALVRDPKSVVVEVENRHLLGLRLPSGDEIFIETQEDSAAAQSLYRDQPSELWNELNRGRDRVVREIVAFNQGQLPGMKPLFHAAWELLHRLMPEADLDLVDDSGGKATFRRLADFFSTRPSNQGGRPRRRRR